MNTKITSIIRIAILFALGIVGLIFLFCKEQDPNLLIWTFRFIVDKTFAFGAIFLTARLYKLWSETDPWLMAYDRMCNEDMEKPNPMYVGDDNKD